MLYFMALRTGFRLNKAILDGDRVNRWAGQGSTRYLWKDAEVEAAIQ